MRRPYAVLAGLLVLALVTLSSWLVTTGGAGHPVPSRTGASAPVPSVTTAAGPQAVGRTEVRLAHAPIADPELGSVALTHGPGGVPLAVTVSDAVGGMLDVVDLTTNRLVLHRPLVDDEAMRGTALNKGFATLADGRVVIATSRAELAVLDPRDSSVRLLPSVRAQFPDHPLSAFSDVVPGPGSLVYVGADNGHAYAANLDPAATAPWADLGSPNAVDGYVTDLAYTGGTIYAGTGLTQGRLYSRSAAGGAWTPVPMPGILPSAVGSVTQVTIAGHHLYATFSADNGTGTTGVLDLIAHRWVDAEPNAMWVVTPGPSPTSETVYTRGDSQRLATYDPTTARPGVPDVHVVGTTAWPGGQMPVTAGWITPTTLLTWSGDGRIFRYDIAAGRADTRLGADLGGPRALGVAGRGPDGAAYVASQYFATTFLRVDPRTHAVTAIPNGPYRDNGQIESFGAAAGRLVVGTYRPARWFTFDPASALSAANPSRARALSAAPWPLQGRPKAIADVGAGLAAVATMPDYLGSGLLTLVRVATGEALRRDVIAADQSVSALAIDPVTHVLYGGTGADRGNKGDDPSRLPGVTLFRLDTVRAPVVRRALLGRYYTWGVAVTGDRVVALVSGERHGGRRAFHLLALDRGTLAPMATVALGDHGWGSLTGLTGGGLALMVDSRISAVATSALTPGATASSPGLLTPVASGYSPVVLDDGTWVYARGTDVFAVNPGLPYRPQP